MIDLRSDLMGPRSAAVALAMSAAAQRTPTMTHGEDPDERALSALLAQDLGVEAVLLTPTCTMANQIAIRLHLPNGGQLASAPLAHIVTVEARATALTGVVGHALSADGGHPSPDTVETFLEQRTGDRPAMVWLENTHMLSAGSMIPAGWQARIAAQCRAKGCALHLDGSRLWNAAAASGSSMADLTVGCDTISLSLNKAISAPVGSVLAGSRAAIEEAVRWRDAMGGEWRPIGSIAAAARAALDGWRDRLELDTAMTKVLAAAIAERLGEAAVHPAPTNIIFLNRPAGDAQRFMEVLARHGVQSIIVTSGIVRLAIHNGVREPEVAAVAAAVTATDAELSRAA